MYTLNLCTVEVFCCCFFCGRFFKPDPLPDPDTDPDLLCWTLIGSADPDPQDSTTPAPYYKFD
jgi:hypothetical protein